jgi:acetyl esterase/lipase
MEGLPPLFLQVGEREALLADSRRIAARARAAGVPVQLEVWPGMTHVWHMLGDGVPEAREATQRLAQAIAAALPVRAAA